MVNIDRKMKIENIDEHTILVHPSPSNLEP